MIYVYRSSYCINELERKVLLVLVYLAVARFLIVVKQCGTLTSSNQNFAQPQRTNLYCTSFGFMNEGIEF